MKTSKRKSSKLITSIKSIKKNNIVTQVSIKNSDANFTFLVDKRNKNVYLNGEKIGDFKERDDVVNVAQNVNVIVPKGSSKKYVKQKWDQLPKLVTQIISSAIIAIGIAKMGTLLKIEAYGAKKLNVNNNWSLFGLGGLFGK